MSAPSLAAAMRRVDEAAVVAAHHRDAVALPTPCSRRARASALRAAVDLAERQLAELVDEPEPVGARTASAAKPPAGPVPHLRARSRATLASVTGE